MSEKKGKEALWRLLVDDGVDQEAGKLVDTAERLITGLFGGQHKMQRKQFSNLLAATIETRSVPVIEDFVRYQMGRDDKGNSWRAGKPRFGEALLEETGKLERTADRLVGSAKARGGKELHPANEETEKQRIWWLLTTRLAGFLEHRFVYEATCRGYKEERG